MNTVARYNWELCDQCSSNPNDLCIAQGIIKNRKIRRSCDWAPCDPNNELVNKRGWFCKSNTDAVLVPQGSKQTGRRVGRGEGLTISVTRSVRQQVQPFGLNRGRTADRADLPAVTHAVRQHHPALAPGQPAAGLRDHPAAAVGGVRAVPGRQGGWLVQAWLQLCRR
jgi:hypothetical protein